MLRLTCPHCESTIDVDDQPAGTAVLCSCGQHVVVPVIAEGIPVAGPEGYEPASAAPVVVQTYYPEEPADDVGEPRLALDAAVAPIVVALGAVVLFAGLFLPLARLGTDSFNCIHDRTLLGVLFLILSAVGLLFTLLNWYRWAWAVGLVCFPLMALTFSQLQGMADEGGLGKRLEWEWGWAALVLGASLLVLGAVLGEARRVPFRNRIKLAGVASILFALAGSALAAWAIPQVARWHDEHNRAELEQPPKRRKKTGGEANDPDSQQKAAANQKSQDEPAKERVEPAAVQQAGDLQAVPLFGDPEPQSAGSGWIDAGLYAVQQGNARVQVVGLTFANQQVRIELNVRNLGKQPFVLRGWTNLGEPRLLDHQGQAYALIRPADKASAGSITAPVPVRAGATVSDVVSFAQPPRDATSLRLELPAEAFGGAGKLRLEIPRTVILLKAGASLGPAVVPELQVLLLRDPFAENRSQAALVLGNMGPASHSALDDLVRAMRDASPLVRQSAVLAVGKLDRQCQHFKALRRALEDVDPRVRAAALEALTALGPPPAGELDAVVALLNSPEVGWRRYAIAALARMKIEPKIAVPRFLEAIKDPDRDVRLTALEALVKARLPEQAIPVLLDMLNGTADEESRMAASILLQVETFRKEHLPGLLKALASKSSTPRQVALIALGHMGGEGGPAVPILLQLLKEADPKVQIQVMALLPQLGAEAAKSAEPLAQLFVKTSSAEIRSAAAAALSALGRNAAGAVPVLLTALNSKGLAADANKILIKIGKGGVPQIMTAITKTGDLDDKTLLIDLLGQMGPEAAQASVLLTNISVNDMFPRVRKAAKEALAKIQGK